MTTRRVGCCSPPAADARTARCFEPGAAGRVVLREGLLRRFRRIVGRHWTPYPTRKLTLSQALCLVLLHRRLAAAGAFPPDLPGLPPTWAAARENPLEAT
jgi:hypothetical protein